MPLTMPAGSATPLIPHTTPTRPEESAAVRATKNALIALPRYQTASCAIGQGGAGRNGPLRRSFAHGRGGDVLCARARVCVQRNACLLTSRALCRRVCVLMQTSLEKKQRARGPGPRTNERCKLLSQHALPVQMWVCANVSASSLPTSRRPKGFAHAMPRLKMISLYPLVCVCVSLPVSLSLSRFQATTDTPL